MSPVKINSTVKLEVDGRQVIGAVAKVNTPVIGSCKISFELGGVQDSVYLPTAQVQQAQANETSLLV